MFFTLEDIARLSGFSRSTVSRVVNGDTNVKEETRKKVLEVLRDHNFQPNLAARGLAVGRTNVIGLVIPAGVATIFTDQYFPRLIQGVSAACNSYDYSVMLWLAEPEYERRMIAQILHSGLVDGVIVSSTIMKDPIVEYLHDSSMPFILVGRHSSLDVNYIDVDNVQGGKEATAHLLRLGRKSIATITGPQNTYAGYDRYQGYLRALEERAIPFRPELVTEGDFTEAGGYTGMLRLIPAKPDAVFVASDMMALGALRALREGNLRVPEDLAVVGYEDMPLASKMEPPLTTIRQPTQEMGTVAVEILDDLLKHPGSSSRHAILTTQLVIRSSCGALDS